MTSTLVGHMDPQAAVLQLACDVADANDARCKTGHALILEAQDRDDIAKLLPNTPAEAAREALIEAASWILGSRADNLRESEIEDMVSTAKAEISAAVKADAGTAGAA